MRLTGYKYFFHCYFLQQFRISFHFQDVNANGQFDFKKQGALHAARIQGMKIIQKDILFRNKRAFKKLENNIYG